MTTLSNAEGSPHAGSLATGSVALVTGASRGIGRAIAVSLAAAGADVIVNHRATPEHAERVAERARAFGRRALCVQADISQEAEVERMVGQTLDAFGKIDVLVNNAGVPRSADFFAISVEEFDRLMAVNVRGPFLCSRAVLRHMVERGSGAIVTVSSSAAYRGSNPCYGASKSAEIGFTFALARLAARHGVRVNCVAPGPIDNSTLDTGAAPDAAAEPLLKRRGYPGEVATAVAYLCSPAASYVTGQVLCVNGGNFLH